jgi:hypothetical protein
VTNPKLPEAPFWAFQRSGLLVALALTTDPSARTISQLTTLSQAKPWASEWKVYYVQLELAQAPASRKTRSNLGIKKTYPRASGKSSDSNNRGSSTGCGSVVLLELVIYRSPPSAGLDLHNATLGVVGRRVHEACLISRNFQHQSMHMDTH